ncbi:hypothetical protein [Thalassomonas sp. RHCl1]|uniref:hypothetical protein n=1 Tax=Thalassomonas sp. RHCl1 TaxID=2995320 RepID=UPI00248B921A|nr:hypothetical protein [Thalassomonas sp. RHCl1]
MNKSLSALALTAGLLALGACNYESSQAAARAGKQAAAPVSSRDSQQQSNTAAFSEQKPYLREQSATLDYLQDLTSQQVADLVGFGNQQLLMLQQGTGSVFSYNRHQRPVKLLADETAPQGKAVACQDYKSEQINWFTLPGKSNNEITGQLNQQEIVAAICGNITAELSPEVFVLTRANEQLALFSVSPKKLFDFNAWRKITTVTADAGEAYSLLPHFNHHSARSLQIARQKQGQWQFIKTLYPREFTQPFKYRPGDDTEIWMKYLNLDRASAKLMWHAGARSIGQLDDYFDSVNPALTSHTDQNRREIIEVLYNLDPNDRLGVSQRLANIFVDWRLPQLNAGAGNL